MPVYEYRCKECGEIYDVRQKMTDDRFEKHMCPKCEDEKPCERLISGGGMFQFGKHGEDLDFQSNKKNRGYRGKYRDMLRPVGTPVDAPAIKSEADRQFQAWVDTGGIAGIQDKVPEIKTKKDDPRRPRSAEEYADRKKK